MATNWESTAVAFNIAGNHYPEGQKQCRFNKVIAEPTQQQLQTFGEALAALGAEDQLVDALLTVKETITFS